MGGLLVFMGLRLPWKEIMISSFFIPPSSLCMLYACYMCVCGGGMGCTHVKYGGQRSMLGVFLNHFPVLVRQGLY